MHEDLRLQPIGGPESRSFMVTAEHPAVIGRGADCAVCVTDPSVSRDHASISKRGDQWIVTDLGSRHGTRLNGIRLKVETATVAVPGDLLGVGPYTFRLETGPPSTASRAVQEDTAAAGMTIERVAVHEVVSIAHRRLDLLVEGAATLHQAETEQALADAILELALAGSGYQRGAVLRRTGSADQVEVIASREAGRDGPGMFAFSQSLLMEAATGHLARLTEDAPRELGHSIVSLSIHSALCAPIVLDTSVIGFLYLDSRGSERPGSADAGGFCHAASRMAGLAWANLKRAELEERHRRLDQDLRAARNAQDFLLPKEDGTVGHLRYAMRTHPGRVVAGDMFDVFALDDDRVGICFGDATGQGMGAAIMMTAILCHLRAAMVAADDPAIAVQEVNRYIVDRSPDDKFASLWVGVFDRRTDDVRFVDAGHGHWLLTKRDAPPIVVRKPDGLLVGIDPTFDYGSHTLDLERGDRVILYSDGLVEHRDMTGQDFGNERLKDVLAKCDSPQSDVNESIAALREFIGHTDLEDDTTVASIEVMG